MMQIKVINNWTKEIIKNFCNFFFFKKIKSPFSCKTTSILALLYYLEKYGLQFIQNGLLSAEL